MSFSYNLTIEGNLQIVQMEGRILDRSEADTMMDEVSKNIEEGKNKLIFNFDGLDYMNSAGLNVLITILTKSRNHYGEMVLCNLSEKVRNLLVTSKLQNIFKLVDTEVDAREKLN
jgi:anti-sigma B factor antagonist